MKFKDKSQKNKNITPNCPIWVNVPCKDQKSLSSEIPYRIISVKSHNCLYILSLEFYNILKSILVLIKTDPNVIDTTLLYLMQCAYYLLNYLPLFTLNRWLTKLLCQEFC